MVGLIKTSHCINGDHDKCNGGDKAPPGHFGGTICTCGCHMKPLPKPRKKPMDDFVTIKVNKKEYERLQRVLTAAKAIAANSEECEWEDAAGFAAPLEYLSRLNDALEEE